MKVPCERCSMDGQKLYKCFLKPFSYSINLGVSSDKGSSILDVGFARGDRRNDLNVSKVPKDGEIVAVAMS